MIEGGIPCKIKDPREGPSSDKLDCYIIAVGGFSILNK